MDSEKKALTLTNLLLNGNKAVMLYGVPGTQKTKIALLAACHALGIDFRQLHRYRYEPVGICNDNGCWELLDLHPGFTYDNFIGVSRDSNASQQSNNFRRGVFANLCKKAAELRDLHGRRENSRKFVLILKDIDQIDISAVFGEMLMALRFRDVPVSTPYTRQISVPHNLYIIATAQAATPRDLDLDTDVFKLFSFMNVAPNVDNLVNLIDGWNIPSDDITAYINKCADLNHALAALADSTVGHKLCQIGELFFAKITDYMLRSNLDNISANRITRAQLQLVWDNVIDPCIFHSLDITSYDSLYQQISVMRDNFLK